jgi:hypothetical protein
MTGGLTVGNDRGIGYVDFDEIEGFLAAIEYLSNILKSPAPSNERDVVYKSRGKVEFGLTASNGKWEILVSANGKALGYSTNPILILGQINTVFQSALAKLRAADIK